MMPEGFQIIMSMSAMVLSLSVVVLAVNEQIREKDLLGKMEEDLDKLVRLAKNNAYEAAATKLEDSIDAASGALLAETEVAFRTAAEIVRGMKE